MSVQSKETVLCLGKSRHSLTWALVGSLWQVEVRESHPKRRERGTQRLTGQCHVARLIPSTWAGWWHSWGCRVGIKADVVNWSHMEIEASCPTKKHAINSVGHFKQRKGGTTEIEGQESEKERYWPRCKVPRVWLRPGLEYGGRIPR